MHKYERKKTAVVGARGYSGIELLRLLAAHPGAEVAGCFARSGATGAGSGEFAVSELIAGAKDVPAYSISDFDRVVAGMDVVFLATPAEASMELVPRALAAGVDVIDLSGAFRLNAERARAWYGLTEEAAALLPRAQYGLVPWAGPVGSAGSPRLVSNPGCYATAVLLGLLPLLKHGLVDPASLVIDAKSGASGAGRKAVENLLYCEVEGDCLPYKVGKHQHLPEIQEYCVRFASAEIDPMFTTHLLATPRGISAGIYARARAGISLAEIETAYKDAYADYPLLAFGAVDEKQPRLLSVKRMVGTPRTEIRYTLEEGNPVGGKLFVFSILDNLMKGAASQAVENFNRLYDFPIPLGLTTGAN